MEYKLVHNVDREDCYFQRSNSGNSGYYLGKSGRKIFCAGFLVGFLVTVIISVVFGLAFLGVFGKKKCNDTPSSSAEQYKSGNFSAENSTDLLSTSPTTSSSYITSQQPSSTVRTWKTHTCQVAGGCTSPPKLNVPGSECVFESTDGRTFVKYTLLNRSNEVEPFDYCPVSVCLKNDIWSSFKVSNSGKECYNKTLFGYKGKTTCTESGRTCQRWDTDYPHKRNKNHIPRNTADLHSNYCRDPGRPADVYEPWCYTTDPYKRWEFCNVPRCENMDG